MKIKASSSRLSLELRKGGLLFTYFDTWHQTTLVLLIIAAFERALSMDYLLTDIIRYWRVSGVGPISRVTCVNADELEKNKRS